MNKEKVAIYGKIDLHRRNRAALEELFSGLLHKLMPGRHTGGRVEFFGVFGGCD